MSPDEHSNRSRATATGRLVGEQGKTLLAIRDFLKQEGRIPTAGELCKLLGENVRASSASMRAARLTEMGFLIRNEDGDLVLNANVIDHPETAALLVELRKLGGQMMKTRFVKLVAEDLNLDQAASEALVKKLAEAQYLNHTAKGWAWNETVELGVQFARERGYLELLGEKAARTKRETRKQGQRPSHPEAQI